MKINLTKKNIEAIKEAERYLHIGSSHMDIDCIMDELKKVVNKYEGINEF